MFSSVLVLSLQDDDLQFLSLEERDCILFFEEIICSLEEDDERKDPRSYTTAPHHDIIDLVHATPDHSKPRDTLPVIPGACTQLLTINHCV